ncbi:MAG: phosphate regulon sensor histidine kinase PhoR [Pseudomonadota bacterium]
MSSARASLPWVSDALAIGGLVTAGAIAGALFDHVWIGISLAVAAVLMWHLLNLYRLHRWLTSRRRFGPVSGIGVWSGIFAALHQRQRESQARRQRLLRSVREIREAISAIPAGVLIVDQDQDIQWLNPSAATMLGLDRRDDVGSSLTQTLTDPRVEAWLAGDDATEELLVDAPTDKTKLSLSLIPFSSTQSLLIAQDVTQLHRVEAMRKDFVANVSHELRTPLTVISGYVEAMEIDASDEWQMIIRRMSEQSDRMRAIVEDLLTLSRLDAIGALEDEVVVNVHGVVTSVANEAEALSGGRHTLVWHASSTVVVTGSPSDLRSAFMNLVSNAIRYTPEGRRISFRWYLRDGQATFEVTDDGPGIAAEHIPRLTERFYRVSTDRSRATGGTGLGLAIVKNILVLHDAALEIESEIGSGTTFRAVFPRERTIDGAKDGPELAG